MGTRSGIMIQGGAYGVAFLQDHSQKINMNVRVYSIGCYTFGGVWAYVAKLQEVLGNYT